MFVEEFNVINNIKSKLNTNKNNTKKHNNTKDENKNAGHINSYLKKYHKNLTPKMFRTWNGNSILLKYLIGKGKPQIDREIRKNLREGIKRVAEGLHNTMAVSKKSYCNSEIYTTYLNDNEKFWEFIEDNKRDNGENKGTDRILTLFLIKYYKDK